MCHVNELASLFVWLLGPVCVCLMCVCEREINVGETEKENKTQLCSGEGLLASPTGEMVELQ